MSNGTTPKISILVPTFNYAEYIERALDSIISQNFESYEVIISDDASSDNTDSIVRPYVEKDERFHFFRHEKNLGMAGNWNWCLDMAKGEYIKFLFADDELTTSDALANYAAMLDKHPDALLATSARRLINDESQEIGIWNIISRDGVHSGDKIIRECLINGTNIIGEPSAVIFRNKNPPFKFDPTFRQIIDLNMWISLCTNSSCVYTSRPLCSFRIHSGQQSAVNKRGDFARSEEARLFDKHFDSLLEKSGTFNEKIKCWSILYFHRHRLGKMSNRTPEEENLFTRIKARFAPLQSVLLWSNYRINRLLKDLNKTIHRKGP